MAVVSIVIVTYNSSADIRRCLTAISRTCPRDTYECIVVDNASHDDSADIVAREYPWVVLRRSPANLGFAGANNSAIPVASARYILLLNPDTEIQEGALASMITFMDAHENCGLCGARLRDGTGNPEPLLARPTVMNTLLYCFGLRGLSSCRVTPSAPGALSGACLMIRATLINEIGLLDEAMHTQEDVDYCIRARRHGYGLAIVENADVIHLRGRSGNPGYVIRRSYESRFRLHHKHTARSGRAVVYAALVLQMVLRYLKWSVRWGERWQEAPVRRRALRTVLQNLPALCRGERCRSY